MPENATVQDVFVSPPDEYLFGSGQFQDGYLNVRGLPRRLTQVNTQIAMPFLLSSKGYGLLWHNYGRTDLNPADNEIRLTQTGTGVATSADVTTSDGTQRQQQQEAVFSGEIDVKVAGPQALLLDVGAEDGGPVPRRDRRQDRGRFANYWLPPTTSWLSTLSAGKHSVRVIGDAKDKPSLFLRPSDDLTTLRSFANHIIDYVIFAGPKSDDVIRRYRDLTGAAPLDACMGLRLYSLPRTFPLATRVVGYARRIQEKKISPGCDRSGLAVLGKVRLERNAVR